MKTGIVTIHNPPNYGAMLQAYALSNYLMACGHETEIVDYIQPELKEYFRFKWSFPPRLANWLRLRRCAAFVQNQQKKSSKAYRSVDKFSEDANRYDTLITGSDQVWFTGPVQYYDPLYFLDIPAYQGRRISYAPSVGGTTDFQEFSPKVSNALSRFDSISVRDDSTHKLVAPLVEKPLTRVVDPTFLCNFENLLKTDSPQTEPYLLLFGNISEKWQPLIQSVAKQLKVQRIITLQYKNKAATHRIASPSPECWINHFKHAAGIVTTYFHGTAFAINFQKQFLSIPTPGRVTKVSALLADVGLESRFIGANDDVTNSAKRFSEPINWSAASSLLGEKVERSKEFLQNALA